MKKNVICFLLALLMLSSVCTIPVHASPKDEQPKFVPLSEEELQKNPTTPESTEELYPLEEEYQEILDAEPEKTKYPFDLHTFNAEKEPLVFEVEKAPEKVWVQNQNNIEVMLTLGLGDRIVGACGLDSDNVPEHLKDEFEKINFYDKMPDLEGVLSLEPDFILGWYSTFDEKRLQEVEFFHDRGIGTYMSLNSACRGRVPQSIFHECVDILTIGKIFDKQKEARKLVDEILEEKEKINEFLENNDRKTVAVLEDEGGVYRVYSEKTLGGNVAINGGANLVIGRGEYSLRVSAEDVIMANPDAIFLVWFGGYQVDGEELKDEKLVEHFTNNPMFSSLKAVKNEQVFSINLSGVYCSGLHTLDGMLDFATNLYPELYEGQDETEEQEESEAQSDAK